MGPLPANELRIAVPTHAIQGERPPARRPLANINCRVCLCPDGSYADYRQDSSSGTGSDDSSSNENSVDSNTSGHENLATLGGIAFGGEDATTKKPRTTSRQNRPPVTTDQAPPATTPHESPQSPTSKPAPTATISYHNEPPVTTKVTSSATTLQKSLQTASSAQQSTASPSVSAGLDTGDDAENACSVSPKLMVRRLAIGQDRRRLARRNGTLKPRAKEPNTSNCFTFTFRGQTPPPTNDGDIPASQDCTDKNGATTAYSHSAIVATIQQGARYALGDPKPQVVGSNRYPHVFQNTPGVDDVTYEPSCSGLTVSEFPILKDGSLMSGGRKSKQDPGTERILFNATKDANGDAVTVYCGIVTHYSQNKINDLDPFRNCGRGSSSTVSSAPQSTQFSTHHSTQQRTTRGTSEQHTTVQQQTSAHPTSRQPQETENPDGSEGSGAIPFPGGFPLPGGAPPGAVPGAFGNTLSQAAVSAAATTGGQAQTTQNNNDARSTAVAQTTQAVSNGPLSQPSENHPTVNSVAQTTSIGGQLNSQVSEPADIYPTTYTIAKTTAAPQTTQAGGDLRNSINELPSTYPTQKIPSSPPTEAFPATETPPPTVTSPMETFPPASLSQPNPADVTEMGPSDGTEPDEPPL